MTLVTGAAAALAMPSDAGDPVAAALVAGAGVAWAIDNNLTATIGGFTPVQITFAKGIVAGSVNLCLGIAISGPPPATTAAEVLLIGALGYGASTVLYVSGAQALGAARSQMCFATNTLWGVLGAWWILREQLYPAQAAAGAVMAAGLVLLLTSRHAHAHTHVALAHTHSHRHDDGHHAHVHEGLPPSTRHTHPHVHEPVAHDHAHVPDLHHRHAH